MTLRIDIWSDIACPWCRIGKKRFDTALAGFTHRDDVEVAWHSYILDPDLPERYEGSEVDYLIERKGMPREQVEAMTSQITEIGASEGLVYDFATVVPSSSRAAHALLKFAEAKGADVGEIEDALFTAHFEDGEVIADEDLLVRIGTEAGLEEDEVRAGLHDPTIARAVEADLSAASQIGVTGVPFFVLDRKYAVSGAQPAETFTQVLGKVWEENHANATVQILDVDASEPDPSAQACGPDGCAVPDTGGDQSGETPSGGDRSGGAQA